MKTQKVDFRAVAIDAARAADDKKASEIVILHIGEQSDVADYLLLASADSSVQLRAIHESVKDQLKSSGLHPLHQEGSRGDKWIAIDYGGLLVHLMHTEVRSYYRLESLWDHPKQITWKKRTLASVVKKKKR